MLRLAFDFIITWRETRTRPNAYVVFMHMRGISTEKGLKIVDNFLLNLKGNEHNKYG